MKSIYLGRSSNPLFVFDWLKEAHTRLIAKNKKLQANLDEATDFRIALEGLIRRKGTSVRDIRRFLERSSMDRFSAKRDTVFHVMRIVAERFNVPISVMTETGPGSRKTEKTVPRQTAMHFVVRLGLRGMSTPKIAKRFNRQDHSTVLHANKQVPQWASTDKEYSAKYDGIWSEINKFIHQSLVTAGGGTPVA